MKAKFAVFAGFAAAIVLAQADVAKAQPKTGLERNVDMANAAKAAAMKAAQERQRKKAQERNGACRTLGLPPGCGK